MDIFKVSLEEISLSGLEGCTLEELWMHLSDRRPAISFCLAEPTKCYIWSQVLSSLKVTERCCPVRLYHLPGPRQLHPAVPSTTTPTPLDYNHPFKYRFISDTSASSHIVVRGSCTTYHERRDVTMEMTEEMPSLTSVAEKYGNSLVLVASQELRERVLVPMGMDPCLEITDVQYGLLEVVGCARHHGISRPFVTSKYLKVDARSTFFYAKQLEKKGLITVKNQNRRAGAVSMLYLSTHQLLGDDFPDKKFEFCSLLSKAPYQCMSLKDLYAELGRKSASTKKELLESGHIEHVHMKDVAEEYANDPALANLKACRLVTPYVAKETEAGEDAVEDDEDGGGDSSSKFPLVAELPVEAQGYRFIDNCGPAGIGQEEFIVRSGLDLTKFANRGIIKNLVRKSKVVAIIQDGSGVRTACLVGSNHVKKNEDYQQLQAEALKSGVGSEALPILTGPSSYYLPDLRRGRDRKAAKVKVELSEETPVVEPTNEVPPMISVTDNLLAELNVSTTDLNESGDVERLSESKTPILETRSVSPSPALLGSESGSKVHHFVRTFKQIKRSRVIMEYFEKHKVVSNLINLAKYIRAEEHKEGLETVLDNKTLRKIIARLVSDHKLCLRQVTLSTEDDDQTSSSFNGPVTQATTLYYIPEASEEEIAVAREAALSAFKSVAFRRALKAKRKKTKKEDDSEGESPVDEDLVDIPGTECSTSRFQRLRHFHCYLWILAYGHGSDSSPSDHTLSGDHVLPKAIFPWAAAVNKLPSSTKGQGSLNFFDICHNMPLSLFLILIKIQSGVKIPSQLLKYFQEDKLRNTTLYKLPAEITKAVIEGKHGSRSDRYHVNSFLRFLEEMKLITIHGNYTPSDRSQLYVNLATSTSILDTSTCKPRRSFFLNEARSEFTEVPYTLSCVADVERYWFDMQVVCQQTAIILGERRLIKGRKANPALQDTHPLVYHTGDYLHLKKGDKDWMLSFNERGFGAGGLPPLYFSHSSRNWTSHYPSPHVVSKFVTSHESLPGVPLGNLPFTSMDVDRGYPLEGGVAGEGLPLSKRMKMSRGVRVTVPGSQVVRNDGGRGRERVRMKKVHKAVKTARKVISKQSQTRRFKLFDEISRVIEDDTLRRDGKEKDGDDRVNLASSEKDKERASWTTEQGNYLLSCYLACCLLHQRGGARVTYSRIKEVLVERFPLSKYKITAVKRYLSVLLRKSPHIRSTIEIRLAECMQEMEAMGEDAPEPTFKSILEFVNKRSEASRNILSQEMLLPHTLEELHKNHTIIGGPKTKKFQALPVVQGEREVNQALISDLIFATLGADESSYDEYKTFKLFESFPERDVMAALDQLRQLQLIKRKRPKMVGIPSKQSPLETQSYTINHNFFAKLEGHFPPNLLQDTANFFAQLHKGQGSSDHAQPGVGWVEDEGHLRVHGDRTRATTAAALLGASSLGVDMEEVRPILPETLYEEVANPDQPEEEEMVDSSTQLLGEEEGDGGSDGEDKEEEEEAKDESVLTREIMRKLKYARGGVSTLFGVGVGPLKYGQMHVEVEPSVNPFEHAQTKQYGCPHGTEEKMEEDSSVGESSQKTSQLTVDDYLTVAKEQLKFDDRDVLFAGELHRVINDSGSEGVQRSSLENHMALNHLPHSHSLDFHIQSLLNFDLIFLVGVSEERLVTWAHSGRWSMSVEDSHSHTITPYRPWSAITPPHLNTALLEKYQHGVLMHIMAHPGISLVGLMHHFSHTLHMNGLREILQVLELSNKVKCSRFWAPRQCALFENSGQEECECSEYYEAVTSDFL